MDLPDIGIPISTDGFRALVTDYLGRMQSGSALSADDYVTMTRLWNTIEFRRLAPTDEIYRRYAAAFFPSFAERVSTILNATVTKGMALYSKDHDLYLGGTPHARSQYRLQDV